MKGIMRKSTYFTAIATFLMSASTAIAVPVHINSGNPAYPFPQFLEYACGGNLGTENPEGLVHAEMERYIRKAYQQHANEFEYTGKEYKGIKYIWTPYKAAYDCSEGDGYALLAAAYMADKVTFDGYWMATHDKRRVHTKRYSDCSDNAPNYEFGQFAISDGADEGGNTAADGDVDVALALYVAYKQWGEFMLDEKGEKVLDACGNPISYKQEMINVIRGLVAMTNVDAGKNPARVNTGIIGLDGYPRGGDTWKEQTDWALQEENYITVDGVKVYPLFANPGGEKQHIDYCAPAYFREFHDLFVEMADAVGATAEWEAEQFRRAEASSDWLIGDLIGKNKTSLPTAGWNTVSRDGSETTYSNFQDGEDYRCPWRTISNYAWHGNPEYSWNPKTHQVEKGGNTYEYDAAVKLSDYMRDPAHWTASSQCYTKGDKKIPYSGPRMMGWQIDPMTGETLDDKNTSALGMSKGASAFAAIGVQDYDLMGDLFTVIYENWDASGTTDDGEWVSNYMSGWFRQTGLMALTGNYQAPSKMVAQPNLKIYRALKDSMSVCHVGDTVTYLLSYRNYGSVDAKDVKIVENVPADFAFVDADNNGVYDAASHTVTWKLSNIAGFKSDDIVGDALDFSAPNLSKTIGGVSYRCKAKNGAKGVYKTTAKISCSNGLGGETNFYPNYVTATMQRNNIEVVPTGLNVEKTADVTSVSEGDTVLFSTIITNDTVPALVGGRSHVNVAVADIDKGAQYNLMFKIYHDAVEPYIDNGNYRVTVFKDLKDAQGLQCSFDLLEGTQNGATMGTNATEFNFKDEVLADGTHKFFVQFPHALAASTYYLNEMAGAAKFNCDGAKYPLRVVARFYDSSWKTLDWSKGWSILSTDSDEGYYYPVTPSYQAGEEPQPVDRLLRTACDEVSKLTKNVLVEEFDGYVWRKVLGDTPFVNGEDAQNVVVTDTIPLGFRLIQLKENPNVVYEKAEGKPYAGVITYRRSSALPLGEKDEMTYACVYEGGGTTMSAGCHVASDKEKVNAVPLVITDKNESDIKNLDSQKVDEYVNVYTTLGALVKRHVRVSSALDGLDPGIYMVGNKKMVKH